MNTNEHDLVSLTRCLKVFNSISSEKICKSKLKF